MNPKEKHDYIFSVENGIIRFDDWIEKCLLGDIQTFIDGIEYMKHNKKPSDKSPRGGGNLSVAILIATGLEFISSLYTGVTKPKDGRQYKATDNVKKFIEDFFTGVAREIPFIMWDGIRNGLTHSFWPNSFRCRGKLVYFSFFVDSTQKGKSVIIHEGNNLRIYVNSVEFYEIMKIAVANYKDKLKKDDSLQDKFIAAWSSYEGNLRDIGNGEVEILFSRLRVSNNVPLF